MPLEGRRDILRMEKVRMKRLMRSACRATAEQEPVLARPVKVSISLWMCRCRDTSLMVMKRTPIFR
jgi:hypothetical protein